MSESVITIKGLKTNSIIGIYEEERLQKQALITDIVCHYDAAKAAHSDHIDDAIDYYALSQKVIHHIESTSHQLLEKLMDELVTLIMKDPRMTYVKVTLSKPKALENFGAMVSLSQEKYANR